MTSNAEQWVREGRARVLPDAFSAAFERYLNRLPWAGSGLDWSRMPGAEIIDVVEATDEELAAWLARTRLGAHDHIAVWFSRERGGIVVPTLVGIQHLDELYSATPGTWFVFGLDVRDEQLEPDYAALLQYSNTRAEWIAAPRIHLAK